jgi:hypothetical protein
MRRSAQMRSSMGIQVAAFRATAAAHDLEPEARRIDSARCASAARNRLRNCVLTSSPNSFGY